MFNFHSASQQASAFGNIVTKIKFALSLSKRVKSDEFIFVLYWLCCLCLLHSTSGTIFSCASIIMKSKLFLSIRHLALGTRCFRGSPLRVGSGWSAAEARPREKNIFWPKFEFEERGHFGIFTKESPHKNLNLKCLKRGWSVICTWKDHVIFKKGCQSQMVMRSCQRSPPGKSISKTPNLGWGEVLTLWFVSNCFSSRTRVISKNYEYKPLFMLNSRVI